ncbi:MAG: hypothetical protein Q9208_005767 [Pyrenodesmia sp. 3 TL-2023]
MLSDLRLLVSNSGHDMRDELLLDIFNARVSNYRAGESSQTFHRQTVDWSLHISGLQHELTSIERTSGNRMLKARDTIRFLTIPGNPKPYNLFSLSEPPDEAIRQRILKEHKNLLDSLERINSSAVQYSGDVTLWKARVKGIDAAIGLAKLEYADQKAKIARRAFKIKQKHREEARLEEARRTDEHIMQLQETDHLTCRTMKHVDRVQQGSEFAFSALRDIQHVLTELMLDCSTGGTCSTFPDELKLLGANDEDIARYWEEQKEKGDESCRNDEEDGDCDEGYLRCSVM